MNIQKYRKISVQLVSEDDDVSGETDAVSAHLGEGLLHRAISVFLFRLNEEGKPDLLLQKRSAEKIVGAQLWANSACGNVRPGESYLDCALRRLHDELGISNVELNAISKFRYQVQCSTKFSENEMDQVFAGWFDGEVALNPDEVSEVAWVAWNDLTQIQTAPKQYAPWLELLLADANSMHALSTWLQNKKDQYAK